ncbi:MAG: class I SAM-dependent methyltransferase [Pseudomonadota bacterium]
MSSASPTNSDQHAVQFWDKFAPRYAKMKIHNQENYEKKLGEAREFLSKDMNVLELGCGTGTTAIKLALSVRHIRATDFSEGMLAIARSRADTARISNVAFELADAQFLSTLEAQFDAAIAFNLLHLVPDPDQVIGEIAAVLKPGGVFISSTFCFGDGRNLLQPIAKLGHRFGLLPSIHFLKSETLLQTMISHGLLEERMWQHGRGKTAFIIVRKPLADPTT